MRQLEVCPKVYIQTLPHPKKPRLATCPKCKESYELKTQPEFCGYSRTAKVTPDGGTIWEHKCGALVVFAAPIF